MPKRGVNIHKRKDGRWEGRFKVGNYPNGGTKYGSIYGKTYKEVKEKLDALKGNFCNENRQISNVPVFREVIEMWLNSRKIRLKGSTEYKYGYLINRHINPELGEIKISDINSGMLNSFLDKKLKSGKISGQGGLAPSYVKTMLHIIQSALAYAANEELCSPLKTKLCSPTGDKHDMMIFTRDEQIKFEKYLAGKTDLTCLGMLISLYAGLRIGEICALSWEDVDLQYGIIHIRHTVSRVKCDESCEKASQLILDVPKTRASKRDIPISSTLMPYLVKAKTMCVSDYVVSDKNCFICPRTYEYRFHRILKRCGINDINYHALRHTFATRCVEAGVDIKSLSEMLGHAGVAITLNTYVHSSMALKRMQIEKLSVM